MHRALDSFDILSEVFEHLPAHLSQDSGVSNRRTLVQAACVCRAFSDPALSVLWRHLRYPYPLFRLIKSLKGANTSTYENNYRLDGDIAEYDLVRFQQYARRIRSLEIHPGRLHVENSVYFHIFHHLKEEFLLPCLTSLNWEQRSPYDTSITTLLSPSLRSLHLKFERFVSASYHPNSGQEFALEMLLQSVFQGCPSLEDVSMSNLYIPLDTVAFTAFQHLHSFGLIGCSPFIIRPVFQTLSTAPTLINLVLEIVGDEDEGLQPSCNGFHALRTLKLSGGLLSIQSIISAVSSTAINSLDIDIQFVDGTTEYADLFRMVASRYPTSLHTLKLGLSPHFSDVKYDIALMQILHPVLTLRTLTRLQIDVWENPLTVADEDMQTLASSFPCLEVLSVDTHRRYGIALAVDLPALSAVLDLAHRLPALRDLTMPFVLDRLQLGELEANPRCISRALRCLRAGQSRLEVKSDDLERVMRCMIAAFPDLVELELSNWVAHDRELTWRPVNRTAQTSLWEVIRREAASDLSVY
ncbi:hypothetical protein B0H21DRAFT_716437 [Amylocystis lapponica]|nr:hypothetical protein B0H21DRAFT_716437 [Amylocystis lapponica]